MIPARTALAQTAAKATPHVGFIYFPHGAVMNRWTPASEGADRRIRRHPEAAGQVQGDDDGVLEHRQPGAHRPGACAVAGHVAVGRASRDQPGAARRHHHRPDRRAADRPGHAAAVARSRDRRPRRRRILRPRLRLLLRRHDFVPHADHAAADGDRPAQAVHPPVRSGRQRRGARAPVEAVRVAARHAHERSQRRCSAAWGRPTSGCCPTISRPSAKSSAAFRRRRLATCRTSTSRTRRWARRPSISTST